MPHVLHQLLLATLVTSAVAVTAVVMVRHAVRRIRRLSRDLRTRMVAAASGRLPVVQVRGWLPGPSREVSQLRRDLRRDVTGTARAVTVGRQAGRPVEALESIVRRLSAQARALDVDLHVIAAEPDRHARRQLLVEQNERIRMLRQACAQVRRGVLLGGAATVEPLAGGMVDDLNDEVVVLGLRARAYHELAGL